MRLKKKAQKDEIKYEEEEQEYDNEDETMASSEPHIYDNLFDQFNAEEEAMQTNSASNSDEEEDFKNEKKDVESKKSRRSKAGTHYRYDDKEKCNVCQKEIVNGSLKEHMLTHKNEKPFICIVCFKGFAKKSALNSHSLLHKENTKVPKSPNENGTSNEDSPGKIYQCPDCSAIMRHKSSYYRHLKVHRFGKTHACTHCDNAYSRYDTLKKHMMKAHFIDMTEVTDY